MSSPKWLQSLIIGGGALIGAGILLHFLFKEQDKDNFSRNGKAIIYDERQKKLDIANVTETEVLHILEGILDSQEKMKGLIRKITAEYSNDRKYTFDELYTKVRDAMPADPLEESGITMAEFDQVLAKYDTDATIQALVGKIMLPILPPLERDNDALNNIDKLIEIHEFMVDKLKGLARTFGAFPNRATYDMKAVTIVVQVISSIEVERKFGYNMEQVECATLASHFELSTSDRFTMATCEMQTLMGEIVGHSPNQ